MRSRATQTGLRTCSRIPHTPEAPLKLLKNRGTPQPSQPIPKLPATVPPPTPPARLSLPIRRTAAGTRWWRCAWESRRASHRLKPRPFHAQLANRKRYRRKWWLKVRVGVTTGLRPGLRPEAAAGGGGGRVGRARGVGQVSRSCRGRRWRGGGRFASGKSPGSGGPGGGRPAWTPLGSSRPARPALQLPLVLRAPPLVFLETLGGLGGALLRRRGPWGGLKKSRLLLCGVGVLRVKPGLETKTKNRKRKKVQLRPKFTGESSVANGWLPWKPSFIAVRVPS